MAPSPQHFLSTASELAEDEPECEYLLEEFQRDQYYPNALVRFRSGYDSIVVNLVQCLPFSELQLIRTHITPIMHHTLHRITLRRLALEDCIFEAVDFNAHVGQIGRYESFKATSGEANHLSVSKYLPCNDSDPYTRGTFIQTYLSWGCSTLTKLEICIEFLHDDVLDRLSLPSLTSLAIVPHAHIICKMWSWRTVYLILKISPNITCFRFEPLHHPTKGLYPFAETTNWKEYKRVITNLPLSQLSSITAYRQLVKRLVPGRPVSFVQILLFPDAINTEINWPQPESDDEVDRKDYFYQSNIVPYQVWRSTTRVKTLYLRRIDEQEELVASELWGEDMHVYLHDACPYATDLWIPSLKFVSKKRYCRDPVDLKKLLNKLTTWFALERCTISSCSPWVAKELEWYREGTILPRRVHATLEELLLGVSVLWKWQDDSEVTGWVLYVSTDIEGSEDSEEGIYPESSEEDQTDSDEDSIWSSD